MINTNLPTLTDRTFGIEMEFEGANIHEVANTLNQVVACHYEGYTHAVTSHWKIVTDGSLPNYSTCGEIVSPILRGEEGVLELKRVCDALDTIEGIKVTRNCGLHIHLGVEDLTVAQIQTVYERYADYEAQIDLVMPRSRRGSAHWCDTIQTAKSRVKRAKSKRHLVSAANKYRKVNLNKLTQYGTIEFRHHSGTLNFTKIVNWLSFLQGFVKRSCELTTTTRSRVSVNKNRPYHQLRTLFENNGYTVEWKRGRGFWEIADSSGRVRERVINATMNRFYPTARENSFEASTCIGYFEEHCGIAFNKGYEYQRHLDEWLINNFERQQANTVTDTGWLDGIDSKVKTYFEEREDELN